MPKRAARHRGGALLLTIVLTPAFPGSLYPSTRYITLSSPTFPTNYNECQALAREFNAEIQTLNQQHEECLQGAPPDDVARGGTCSKSSCQALHTARDRATAAATKEQSVCSARVANYLAAQQQEQAQRQRRVEAESERERRQQAVQKARDQRDAVRDSARVAGAKSEADAEALRKAQDRAREVAQAPAPEVARPPPTLAPVYVARAVEATPLSARPAVKPLSGEQKDALKDAGLGMLVTYLADLSLKGLQSAVLRGVGKTLDNPVLEIAKPFLEVENYKNIRDTIEAQQRQGRSGSWNENEARQLDELDRQANPNAPDSK